VGNAATIERLVELWTEGRIEEGLDIFDPEIEWSEPPETIGTGRSSPFGSVMRRCELSDVQYAVAAASS